MQDATLLALIRARSKPVDGNRAAWVWDLGDGVAGFELLTKMNVMDPEAQDALEAALETVKSKFRALVIGNDHPRAFSSGADLRHFVALLRDGKPEPLERFVSRGQSLYRMMLAAPFPVVGAAFGLALGGGCEMLLHCDRIVAHSELSTGLPEFKVGLLPAWGGCVRMLHRSASLPAISEAPLAAASHAFKMIVSAQLSGSALDAKTMGILQPQDIIVMSRAVLIARAKAEALEMADGYQAPEPALIAVTGQPGHRSLMDDLSDRVRADNFSEHDAFIASVVARVVTGGDSDPGRMVAASVVYDLERDGLVDLVLTFKTRERIEAMLATGRPLRN